MDTRRIILFVLGILLIVGSFFAARAIIESKTKRRPSPQKMIKTVVVDTVKNTTVAIVVPANGNLVAKQRVELYAEVQGVFRPVGKLFKTGQAYRKGQPLIKIDASEHYANVQSAKSDYYKLLTSILPDLRLDYAEVFQQWQDYVSNFDMEKPTPKLPEFRSEKEKFFISGKGVLASFYNVKNLEQRLSKYTISAPFDGVLTDALVTEGTLVRAGQKLGEFIKTGTYELQVALPKTYGDFLRVGKKVRLENLEKTKQYEGKVSRINGRVDLATQTVTAFIEVSNDELSEGQYLEARLDAREEPNAIEVDRSLMLDNNQIYVVRDSVLAVLDVAPVYFSEQTVVLKNVPDGETIVAKPVVGAYPGMLVKVFQQEAKSVVE